MDIENELKKKFGDNASDIIDGLSYTNKTELSSEDALVINIKGTLTNLHESLPTNFKAICVVITYALSMNLDEVRRHNKLLMKYCTPNADFFVLTDFDEKFENINVWMAGKVYSGV